MRWVVLTRSSAESEFVSSSTCSSDNTLILVIVSSVQNSGGEFEVKLPSGRLLATRWSALACFGTAMCDCWGSSPDRLEPQYKEVMTSSLPTGATPASVDELLVLVKGDEAVNLRLMPTGLNIVRRKTGKSIV